MNPRGTKTRDTIKGKVYPSTDVPFVRSQSEGERPRITPQEMKKIVQRFSNIPIADRPKIRLEHSANPREEVGVATELEYDEQSKWLTMTAKIYNHAGLKVEDFLSDGIFKNGISLSYFISGEYKDFIEISLVKYPDFKGATIEYYHDKNSSTRLNIPISNGIFLPPEMSSFDFQRDSFLLEDGTLVIHNPSLLEGAQQYAIANGIPPEKVIVEPLDKFNQMQPEEQKRLLAALVAQNRAAAEKIQKDEETAASQKQMDEARKVYDEHKSVVDFLTQTLPDDQREGLSRALGNNIMNNPASQSISSLVKARLGEVSSVFEENAKLKEEISAVRNQLSTNFSNNSTNSLLNAMQTPSVFAHSGNKPGAPSKPVDMWTLFSSNSSSSQSTASAPVQYSQHSSSSSSTSFPQQPQSQLQQQQPPEIKRHSSKRCFMTMSIPHEYKGQSLFHQPAERQQGADGQSSDSKPAVFSHSARGSAGNPNPKRRPHHQLPLSIPERDYLGAITKDMPILEVQQNMFNALLTGQRDVGPLPPTFFRENLIYTAPLLFNQILVDGNEIGLETNGRAGLTGYKEKSSGLLTADRGLERAKGIPRFHVSNDQF